jgi:hypothetical protein
MPICPNKNLDSWKSLVASLKSKFPKRTDADIDAMAHVAFIRKGDGTIPTIEDASALIFKGKTKQLKQDAKEAFKAFKMGKKEGAKDILSAQKEFAKKVSDYLRNAETIRGVLSDKQVAAIVRRANKIGASEKAFKRFTDYFDKVVDDANYDADVATGKKLQSQLTKPFAEAAAIIKRMRKVPVEELSVEDLRAFNEIAKTYVDSKKPVTSKDYKPFSVKDAEASFSKIEQSVREKMISDVEAAYDVLGLSEEEASMLDEFMNAEDVDEYFDNLTDAKKKDIRGVMERVAEYSILGLKEKLSVDSEVYLEKYGKETLNTLKRISDADVKKIQDVKQLAQLTKIVDNAVTNDSNANIGTGVAIVNANERLPRLISATEGVIKGVVTPFTKFYYDTAIIFKRIFGDRKATSAVRFLTGYEGVITASGIAEKETLVSKKEWDKFRKANNIDNSAETDLGIGVYSRLSDVRKGFENEDYLNEKRLLELSIDRLKSSTNKEDLTIGDFLGLIYDVAVKENNTYDGFLKSFQEAYPNEVKASKWVSDNMWKKIVNDYRIHAEENLNETFDDTQRDNYHPRGYKVVEEVIEVQGPEQDTYYKMSLNPKETGRSKERILTDRLPKDKVVDYRFEYHTFKEFQSEIFEINSYRNAKTFEFMSKLDGFDKVFGGRENANFVRETYNQQYGVLRYGKKNADELSKSVLVSAARTAKNIGSAIALARPSQILTQATPFINTIIQNPKYLYDVLSTRVPSTIKLFDFAIIGARGIEMGAVGRAETSEALTYTKAQRGVKKVVTDFAQWTGRNRDRSLFLLSKADVTAAQKSFLSYYLKYMNEIANVPTSAKDLATEHTRMDDTRRQAISYAQQAVDETQGSSSRALLSQFKRNESGSAFGEIVRNIVMPFNNFASNTRARILEDGNKILFGNSSQRAEAAVDLAGTTVETAAFAAINAFIVTGIYRYGLKNVLQYAFDLEDDKDFYEFMSNKFKTFYTSMTRELLLSGFGSAAENAGVSALNRLAYLIQNSSEEESGEDYYEWLKRDPLFKPQFEPKPDAISNVIGNIGGYGIAFRAGTTAWDEVSSAISGEATTEFTFEKRMESQDKRTLLRGDVAEKIYLEDNERAFYLFMGLLNGAAILTGLSDADITRAGEQAKYSIERQESPSRSGTSRKMTRQ